MKILLIDLSSIFWQTWHATKNNELNSAFELTIKKITRYADSYDHVGIAIDSPPYKRNEIDENYKMNRDKHSELALGQLSSVKSRLESDGFCLFSSQGLEADDIIASIVEQLKHRDGSIEKIDILTGDKDLTQLVSTNVNTISVQTGDRFGPSEVVEKFGVMPQQVHDLLSLVGDNSDNVPGVPGIGVKWASKLIKTFGSVPEILRHIDAETDDLKSFTPYSVVEKLCANAEQLKKSYELVHLVSGATVPIESLFSPRHPVPLTSDPSGLTGRTDATEGTLEVVSPAQTTIIRRDEWNRNLEPTCPEQAWQTAVTLHNSRLYENFSTAESIFAVILRGRALGIDATTALDSFHVINGRPTMSANLMVGLVLNSKKSNFFKCIATSDEIATYKTHRKGDPDSEPTVLSWTIDDARRLGLTSKDNWKKQPANMLRHRCAAALARLVYPDVVGGLYTPEEIEYA